MQRRAVLVTLTTPNGERLQLSTPDPKMIGPWLLAWFEHYEPGRAPVTFQLTIS